MQKRNEGVLNIKRITSVLFSILIVLPAVFANGEIVRNKIEKPESTFTNNIVDAPTWKVGNSWTYYVKIHGDFGEAFGFNLIFDDLVFTVQTVETTTYTLSVIGNVDGDMTIKQLQIIKGTLQDTKVNGTIHVEKTNIGFKKIDAEMQGKIAIAGIPVKPFTLNLDLTITPAFSGLVFPINIDQKYMIPLSDVEGKAQISFIQNPIYIDEIAGGDPADCTGKETLSVAAGTYETYKIESEGDVTERYYAEEAGNIIKAYGDKYNLIDIYLKSTNYGLEPGSPNKPSRPSGPSNGVPDTIYEYSSSTTDPEGDDIYYLFDWGDGSNTGWMGPYTSGEIVTASHSWSRKGMFKVKVKAKDADNHESSWSDPLSVSIPRNKNILRTSFLEKLKERLFLDNKKITSKIIYKKFV